MLVGGLVVWFGLVGVRFSNRFRIEICLGLFGGRRDVALLVVDLLGFLVAHEQHRGAEEEDGGAPGHAVGPAELPHGPVAQRQLLGEEHRVDHQRYQRRDHCINEKCSSSIKIERCRFH